MGVGLIGFVSFAVATINLPCGDVDLMRVCGPTQEKGHCVCDGGIILGIEGCKGWGTITVCEELGLRLSLPSVSSSSSSTVMFSSSSSRRSLDTSRSEFSSSFSSLSSQSDDVFGDDSNDSTLNEIFDLISVLVSSMAENMSGTVHVSHTR